MIHNGIEYKINEQGTAHVAYDRDRAGRVAGTVDYAYIVSGMHFGPPLTVWLCNVHPEYDDDGPGMWISWNHMMIDDVIIVDEIFLDAYSDALNDDVRELWRYS